jgi:hypothetical protein
MTPHNDTKLNNTQFNTLSIIAELQHSEEHFYCYAELCVFALSFVNPSTSMLSTILPSVVMLIVIAPFFA